VAEAMLATEGGVWQQPVWGSRVRLLITTISKTTRFKCRVISGIAGIGKKPNLVKELTLWAGHIGTSYRFQAWHSNFFVVFE